VPKSLFAFLNYVVGLPVPNLLHVGFVQTPVAIWLSRRSG